jgi:hypothetical protein
VQVFDSVLGGEFEAIAAYVTFGIISGVPGNGVQWLVDVSGIVDQQSQVEAVS